MVESIHLEDNMKKYLSIGEVSKIKGVSVKSLRYYAELGILIPAYVNPQTGYRYYTIDQMVTVDLIWICIELDIPLKNFNSYITKDGTLRMDKILEDGKKIADDKIMKLNNTISLLENISKHLEKSQTIKKYSSEYNCYFDERYVFVNEWNGDIFDMRSFMENTTKLYSMCERYGATYLYNQGVIYFHKNNRIENMVFIEISKPKIETQALLKLPKGNYQCEVFGNDNIEIAEKKYIKNRVYPNGSIVIGRELYDTKIESNPTPVEMQVFIPWTNFI